MSESPSKAELLARRNAHPNHVGWLTPELAYRFYTHGQVRQLINRFTTLMVKAGYEYARSNVKNFIWSPVESKLETHKLPSAMKQAATWAFVFGGAAIEHLTEDGDRDASEELKLENVRAYKGMKVWSAYELRPESGKNYRTAEWFVPRWGVQTERKIHRSRLSIVVVEDTPAAAEWGSGGLLNTTTNWPASWLEGIYDAFCELRNAHGDADALLQAKSMLHLKLLGWRKVKTSPDTPESVEAQAALEATIEEFSNSKVMVTDIEDQLVEVSRDLAHVADLIERKELWYAASAGVPKELVIMMAEGNLGVNSAPIDAYNDVVDGWRTTMYTPVIERATDIELAAMRYQAQIRGEPIEVPTEYTVRHRAIEETTEAEDADARSKRSDARKRDSEWLPLEVLVTDPSLQNEYTGMSAWLEQQAEKQAASREAAAAMASAHPEGEDMVSASAVASKIGCSPATVIKMATTGAIPGSKIRGRWKFYLSKVLAAVAEEEIAAAEAADQRTDDGLGLSESTMFGEVYGASVAMREVFAVLERVRGFEMPVLLLGETGVGKEGVARGLHVDGPFVAVNCAALPYEASAVAAAVRESIEKAAGGTLFLDEVGDLSREGQSALLRELSEQDGARVISATSLDIRDEYAFRPDLYYRLAGVEVEIPPLRDREDDVHWLARKFYRMTVERHGMEAAEPEFTEPALAAMLMYHWPGNIREFRSAVERGVAIAGRANPVGVEHMQLRLGAGR